MKGAGSRMRHPMCPCCEYDLRGNYDRFSPGDVRCPECGERFEHNEVQWSPLPDDWTTALGLMWAARSLAWRCALVIVILLTGALVMDLAVAGLFRQAPTGGVLLARSYWLPALAIGLASGLVMIRGLCDAAGFESWLLAFLAGGATLAAALVAQRVGSAVLSTSHVNISVFLFFATAVALPTIAGWYYREHE